MNNVLAPLFAVTVLFVAGAAARADINPATKLYVDTVTAMQALPQPPFVTYRLVTEANTGLHVSLDVYDHDVWLHFAPGLSATTWSVAHRSSDFRSLIVGGDGNSYVTDRAFFDPTWDSAYHAMRTGMFFDAPTHSQPNQRAVPSAAPTLAPEAALETIATTEVVVSTLYTARDVGVATCADGATGRALKFTPKGAPMLYQLVGAVVDTPRHLFCVLIFTLPSLDGTPLTDIQFYGERDGYWLRTGGEFVRSTNRTISNEDFAPVSSADVPDHPYAPSRLSSTVHSTLTLRYTLTEMAFPTSIPEDFFVTPPGQ